VIQGDFGEFKADYNHQAILAIAWPLASNLIERPNDQHGPAIPDIHYGLLASGNQLMRDDALWEKYCTELGILCFEMEAAGLMDSFPCLVIRGISNYSDPHKNDRWKVSAAAAAACAKDLLLTMPTYDVDRTPTAGNIVAEAVNNAG
jgi:nucleoside phosphorylase